MHLVEHKNYYSQKHGKYGLTFRCSSCAKIESAKTRRDPDRRKTTSNGYVKLYAPENPMADKRGEVYVHRFVMAEKLGRPLERWEHVHHIDGDRTNNKIANLALVSNQENHVLKDTIARIHYLEGILRAHGISF